MGMAAVMAGIASAMVTAAALLLSGQGILLSLGGYVGGGLAGSAIFGVTRAICLTFHDRETDLDTAEHAQTSHPLVVSRS